MPFPVTYLIDQPAPSETFVRREVELLRGRGWAIDARMLSGGEPLAYALRDCPRDALARFLRAAAARVAEELFRSPRTALRILRRLPQAASLAAQARASGSPLLHAHFAGITADLASIAAAALALPWTCSVHARDVFTAAPDALWRRLRSARAIAACSLQAARAVTGAGIAADRVSVLHHGLPLGAYPFRADRPGGLIFTACRLEPKKGLDTLLLACSRLQDSGVPFTCVIAGTGPALGALKALAEEKELSARVAFAGWLSEEETRSQLAAASVLALPSRRTADGDRDGIANILVEGLALGTPVVTTTAGAAAEVLADDVNGRLVPPDNPERLAEALAGLLGSEATRLRLSAAGRRTAEEQFDGSACIRQLEAFFERARSPASATPRPTPA